MPASPFEKISPGTIFAQDYRIVGPLGQGGMGAVYEVEQVSTGKPRALKLMLPQLVDEPRSMERFLQEARVSGRIESDHVVEIVGSGIDAASNVPWIAMELLRGETLDEAIESRGALPAPAAHELFVQLRHALGAAHRVGLVHRDLKPENIFLATPRREGVPFTVKVLDFGIAKVIKESKIASTTTNAVGSPLWMAPEQTRPDRISAGTDVWAAGLLAFYALTGRSYWLAAHSETRSLEALFVEILFEPLESASKRAAALGAPDALPHGFDDWFAQCVCRDVEGRFADGSAALGALLTLTSGFAPVGLAPTVASSSVIARATPSRAAPLPAAERATTDSRRPRSPGETPARAQPSPAYHPASAPPAAAPHYPSYPPAQAYALPPSALATPLVPNFGALQPPAGASVPPPSFSAPPGAAAWNPPPSMLASSTASRPRRGLVVAGAAVVLLAAGFLVGGLLSTDSAAPSTPAAAPPARANLSPVVLGAPSPAEPVIPAPPEAPSLTGSNAAGGGTTRAHAAHDRPGSTHAPPPTTAQPTSPQTATPTPATATPAPATPTPTPPAPAPAPQPPPVASTAPPPSVGSVTVTPAHYDTAPVMTTIQQVTQRCWTNAQRETHPHPTEVVRIEVQLNPTGRAYPVYVRGANDVHLGWCIGAELQRREFVPTEESLTVRTRLTLTPD